MSFFSQIAGSNAEVSLPDRLFNSMAFLSTMVLLASFILNEIGGFPFSFDIFILMAAFAAAITFYLSRFKQQFVWSRIVYFAMAAIMLPLAWFNNQGLTGTTVYYFYSFLLVSIMTMYQNRILYGAFAILYVLLIAFVEYLFPGLVKPFATESLARTDFFYSFLVNSIALLAIASLVHRGYENERTTIAQQNELLEDQRDNLALLNNEFTQQNAMIEEQKYELEDINAVNNKLFSIISHDLRSPLANLETTLQIITLAETSPDETQMLLKGLQRDLNHTSNLLENLLHWAKNQRKGIEPQTMPFDIVRVIEENIRLIENRALAKGIRVTTKVPKNATVLADQNMIRLVIRNLLSNAVKFCSSGNRIELSVLQPQANMWQVTVSDTGLGIPLEAQARIFRTVDYTNRGTDNEKGSGLGLFLCQDFVSSNGGSIWFDSEPGKGSNFHFTLPVSSEQAQI